MSLPHDPASPSSPPPAHIPATRPAPRRGLLIGGVTVLLLAAAWGGSTAYSAGQAEQVSDTLARTLDTALNSRQVGRVERHTFTRGLTESTDDLYLVLGKDTDAYHLHLRNHIQHGPLPGLRQVGQAAIDTEIVWDAQTQAQLDKAFGGRKPVIHTLIGLGGTTDTTVQIPAGRYAADGETATWQALSGQVRVQDGGRGVQGTLTWPGGTEGSSEGAATLSALRYTVDQRPYLNHLSQGTSELSVASVRLPGDLGHIDGLKAVTTTAPSGTNLGSRTELAASTLSAEGQTFSALKMVLSASGLSSAALEELAAVTQRPEYQQALNASGSDAASLETTLGRLATDLRPALHTLLAGNPLLAVNEISVRTPEGPLKLSLGAQVVDGGSIDLGKLMNAQALKDEDRSMLLLNLLGNLKLTADVTGAQRAIAGLLGSGGDEARGIAQSVEPMVEAGMITRTGDTLSTHLEFGKNGATINGKPVPLQ